MYEYIQTKDAGMAVYETVEYWWRPAKTTHVGWILKTVNFWWTYSVVNYRFTPISDALVPRHNKHDKYDTIEEAQDAFVEQYESLKYWRDTKKSLARKV